MCNHKYNLLGMKLTNPIIVASGPMCDGVNLINRFFSRGAAAVVTKTITCIESKEKSIKCCDNYIFNRDGYSNRSIQQWCMDLDSLQDKNVIVNIFAQSSTQLAELCKIASIHKAKAVELCLSCPTRDEDPICFNLDHLREICITVRRKVDIPISVKILLTPSIRFNRQMVALIKDVGIDCITVSDSFPARLLDHDYKAVFSGNGGLSGDFMKPLVLKFLHDIMDIKIEKIAVGGVYTGKDVRDYLSAGANAVGVCSAILRCGNGVIEKINKEFNTMEERINGQV